MQTLKLPLEWALLFVNLRQFACVCICVDTVFVGILHAIRQQTYKQHSLQRTTAEHETTHATIVYHLSE